jgi:uncharacterized membrane protein
MASTWHGGRPLWGDHGSFAFFLFVPLGRLNDPAQGVLVVQALLVAAWIPIVYLCARAFKLDRGVSLALACVAAASRPIENAAFFDFHPECALPLLLVGLVLCHRRRHRLGLIACALLAAATKDIAALTVGMALVYLALRDVPLRRLSALLAVSVFLLAAFDILLLPLLTGWYSYLHMNTSAPVDVAVAASTTWLRSANSLFVPWVHPFTWFAGAPWAAAAALSPKLAVKGVEFQYGFLFAPVAMVGAVFLADIAARRLPRIGRARRPAARFRTRSSLPSPLNKNEVAVIPKT